MTSETIIAGYRSAVRDRRIAQQAVEAAEVAVAQAEKALETAESILKRAHSAEESARSLVDMIPWIERAAALTAEEAAMVRRHDPDLLDLAVRGVISTATWGRASREVAVLCRAFDILEAA
jgi:multidrug resistance efflux pump